MGNVTATIAVKGFAVRRFLASVAVTGIVLIGVPAATATAGPLQTTSVSRSVPGSLQATLNSPTSNATSDFGTFVSMSGTTAVVGAPGSGGAVYIYNKGRGGWSQVAVLRNPAGDNRGTFGDPVVIQGSTIAVGGSGGGQLAVYVYVRKGGQWATIPTAVFSDPARGDGFGSSLAVDANTVAVGAPATNGFSGATYLYHEGTTGWPSTPSVVLADPRDSANDDYGSSVALSGSTLVVGAAADLTQSAAYIYQMQGMEWPSAPTTVLGDPSTTMAWFGLSVAISGRTIVVGDPGAGGYVGAAYVYVEHGSGWSPTPAATLANPTGDPDLFAAAASIGGQTIALTSFGGASYGAAYLYSATGAGWPTQPTVTVTDPAAPTGNLYGDTTSISGAGVIVGAPGVRSSGLPAAAYVYQG